MPKRNADLAPTRRYTGCGWTRDKSYSTGGVDFTLADVQRLKPGQTLVDGSADMPPRTPKIVSLPQFTQLARQAHR